MKGRLTRVLPGVFTDPGQAEDPVIKMAAVTRWDPDAVIRGRAAAAVTYWPDIAAALDGAGRFAVPPPSASRGSSSRGGESRPSSGS